MINSITQQQPVSADGAITHINSITQQQPVSADGTITHINSITQQQPVSAHGTRKYQEERKIKIILQTLRLWYALVLNLNHYISF